MPGTQGLSEFSDGFSETDQTAGIARKTVRYDPMGRPIVNHQSAAGGDLSVEEIVGAFEALPSDDKLRLTTIEAIRRRGTGFGPGELIHEAVCRALTGARTCPRDVPLMAFMATTMRSVASHDREQRRRTEALGYDSDGTGADAPSPEDVLIQNEEAAAVQAIHGQFDDDPEVQLVLLGWQDGLRGVALREATGLDQGQLDYAIKRMRTRMRKTYPQGWIS
jgi:DNA-directed RNA polymerase specialized sigma24 family protein